MSTRQPELPEDESNEDQAEQGSDVSRQRPHGIVDEEAPSARTTTDPVIINR